jgi:hypothetical protein
MNLGAELAELRDQFREEPRVVVRGLGELVVVAVLLLGTFALLPQGVTDGTRPLWLALVALGTGFVLLPTLVDPLRYEYRRLTGDEA